MEYANAVTRMLIKRLIKEFNKMHNEIPKTPEYRKAKRDYVQHGLQSHFRALEEEQIVRYH